jgi:hypothetical protein
MSMNKVQGTNSNLQIDKSDYKKKTSESLVRICLFIYDIIPSCNSVYQII